MGDSVRMHARPRLNQLLPSTPRGPWGRGALQPLVRPEEGWHHCCCCCSVHAGDADDRTGAD
eukprot:225220-Lingulodinium_polyedra.AAC.1